MHDLKCSVNFQVNVSAPASKDSVNFILIVQTLKGRLDSRVVFTLDYIEHRYAVPWAVRLILGDDHSFLAQA